jgi:prolyl-tRNA synthetase
MSSKKGGDKPAKGGDKAAKGPVKASNAPVIIGMTATKETHFSAWYQELVLKAELVEYYHEVCHFVLLWSMRVAC